MLPVVVVDLHMPKILEVIQVVGKEHDEIALESRDERFGLFYLFSRICEGLAGVGSSTTECFKTSEDSLPFLHVEVFI